MTTERPRNYHTSVSQPSLTEAEVDSAAGAVRSGRITQGARVAELQDKFAAYIGSKYALACSSGTSALHLALLAIGAGPGDEVIVPDLSFVATANAVTYTGAKPVLCDVNVDDWGLNVEQVKELINERTIAIIAVHLYGVPCRVEELRKVADDYGLCLIEDAAEGLCGGTCPAVKLGTIGDIGTFSFYGNKIITTGEGGMVVTNNKVLHDRMYKYRGQGVVDGRRYYHDVVGYNYRMTDIQAAIGIEQLGRIDEILLKREAVFNAYKHELSGLESDWLLIWPRPSQPAAVCAPWLFTVAFRHFIARREVELHLADAGYETRPVFVPMHLLPMYAGADSKFSVSNDIRSGGLSLPTHSDLSRRSIDEICSIVRRSSK